MTRRLWAFPRLAAAAVCVTVLALATFASPVRSALPVVLSTAALCGVAIALLLAFLPQHRSSRLARARHAVASDLRAGVTAPAVWPGVVGCPGVVLAGHLATFLIAARAAGSTLQIARLLPWAMPVLLAAALRTNIGGWGPREGVAARVFSLAGLGAAQGVATGTTSGVLATAASLPGAAPLVAGWMTRRTHRTTPTAHTGVARRRRLPTTIPAVEGVLDG